MSWLTASIALASLACESPMPGGLDAATPDARATLDVPTSADASVPSDAPVPLPDASTHTMRMISRNVPAYASSGSMPGVANDSDPTTNWSPTVLPAWIAYDLSASPVADRQAALVVWNAEHSGNYLNTAPAPGDAFPVTYTLEINSAPGGSAPPTTGWTTVVTMTGNSRGTVQHPVQLGGASWVRMAVTQSTDPGGGLAIDLDVYTTPSGATDSWLFMGDSITYISVPYAFSDLPSLVAAASPPRWPAVINAAIGGTNTGTAVGVIDDTMAGFPGRYVVLAYGTNDGAATFEAGMETLIQHVLAAGRIPVIPHMPWSDQRLTVGPMINAAIDDLYARYPQVVRGPDLWGAFLDRTDLIPTGDVHPNAPGRDVLRAQWAAVMAAQP